MTQIRWFACLWRAVVDQSGVLMTRFRAALLAFTTLSVVLVAPASAQAESILGAMAKAYENNPDLNAARAGLRATDEGVAIAKSGYRPTVSAGIDVTATDSYPTSAGPGAPSQDGVDAALSVSVNQTVFDGFQTRNAVLGAQSDVFAGQESLRDTEQDILLAAVEAFMNVVRDRQIVSIRRQNLEFLREQLNAADARFQVGEGTRTDVAQARASLAASEAGLTAAVAQLRSSEAVYVQIVGTAPDNALSPQSASARHPAGVARSRHRQRPCRASAGSLGAICAEFGRFRREAGGRRVASGRLGQRLIRPGPRNRRLPDQRDGTADRADLPRWACVGAGSPEQGIAEPGAHQRGCGPQQPAAGDRHAWTQYEASRAQIQANRSQIEASNLALSGVIEERDVGQRTTLDVLNAQQDVLNARESLAQAERDAIVAGYSVLSTTGRLTVERLGLQVANYDPDVHYEGGQGQVVRSAHRRRALTSGAIRRRQSNNPVYPRQMPVWRGFSLMLQSLTIGP
jgi:outer membrane protein